MKNWKKWLVAGCMAALLGIGTMGTTAMAMGGGGVDRSEAVAEEEKVPSGKATQNSRVSSKAWKKINGVCYNGSGQKLEGAVTRGIDVSEWQDTINWSQVKKSNVDFAFVRISYGLNHLDKTYDYNMKQAEKAGVPTGTYVYSLAAAWCGPRRSSWTFAGVRRPCPPLRRAPCRRRYRTRTRYFPFHSHSFS